MKISGKPSGELAIKRLYLPGVVAYFSCPACAKEISFDFADDYLSYPTPGKEEIVCLCCPECEEEIYFTVVLKLNLTEIEGGAGFQSELS